MPSRRGYRGGARKIGTCAQLINSHTRTLSDKCVWWRFHLYLVIVTTSRLIRWRTPQCICPLLEMLPGDTKLSPKFRVKFELLLLHFVYNTVPIYPCCSVLFVAVGANPSGGKRAKEVGGFGEVQVVRHRKTGANFAMKTVALSRLKTKAAFDLAVQEVDLLKSLDHPNIVRLQASGCPRTQEPLLSSRLLVKGLERCC